jgi:hypothetical protein
VEFDAGRVVRGVIRIRRRPSAPLGRWRHEHQEPDYRWSIRGESWAQVYRVGHGYGDFDVDIDALFALLYQQRCRLGEALIAAADLDLAETDKASHGYVNLSVSVNDQRVASVLPEQARAVGLALIAEPERPGPTWLIPPSS